MTFTIYAASRVGCVRANNEDMLLVDYSYVRNSKMQARTNLSNTDRYLLALADGMGGHQRGEVASSLVLHNLHFFFNDIPAKLVPGDFFEAIYGWLGSINNTLEAQGQNDPDYRGMGTTLVALAFYNKEFYWMNCGDSRLYRLRNGELTQITTDHSLNNLMGSREHSNVITNCIGGGCKSSYIDMVQCTPEIQPSDTLLLCSDGLSDMLTDEQIKQIILDGGNADTLCQAAEAAGGYDNVSVILVHVSD